MKSPEPNGTERAAEVRFRDYVSARIAEAERRADRAELWTLVVATVSVVTIALLLFWEHVFKV